MPAALDSKVDVLIIGAGPSGLMAAAWMARCGIKTRIVDKRGTRIFRGHADGLTCRTLEILDTFGFADRAWKDGNHVIEVCFWNPDHNGVIHRTGRIPSAIPGLSRFPPIVLHQGRVEGLFLDHIKKHGDIHVERGVLPTELTIDELQVEDPDAYPCKVTLRHLSEDEATPKQLGSAVDNGLFRNNLIADDTDDLIHRASGKEKTDEIVYAKYVIGCDGAHSWTRRQLGFAMEGEQTESIWGVLDIIPQTNFPDIRNRSTIHSAESGTVMIIPRENMLVRLYIQLTEVNKDGGVFDRSTITPDIILRAAQTIMSPYTIQYDYCHWWTAYQIGQRVGNEFSKFHRVFLAGDAIHTHSPKAGQGMNISMQDTYNLGWKIAHCVLKRADRSILQTYQSERRQIAKDLIELDRKFSRLFSGRPAKDAADEAGISIEEFQSVVKTASLFTGGFSIEYSSSLLVAKGYDVNPLGDGTSIVSHSLTHVVGKAGMASNIKLGMRFPSFQVLNQADARAWQFQKLFKSDGRWRIVNFAGDISQPEQMARVVLLAHGLETCVRRYTPSTGKIDSIIEILTVHSAPRHHIELLELPEIFHPYTEAGSWDYWKVYVDDASYNDGHGHAYKNYGVDRERGCLVVVRPDGYVGYIGELEDVSEIDSFFGGFMIPLMG